MRNLKQYPLTLQEITKCLEDLAQRISDEGFIGDIRPLCLRTAPQIVTRSAFATSEIHIPKM